MTRYATLVAIRTFLNTTESVTAGLSRADAVIDGRFVRYSYPAPVISGVCEGYVELLDDDRLLDSDTDQAFDNLDAWKTMMQDMINLA